MYAGIHSVTKCSNRTLNDLSPVYTAQTSLCSKCKKEGERGRGGGRRREKRKRESGEEGRERSAYNQSPHNSMFLCSKSGRKMLIGRDMSREAVSYSLTVRLASACFKSTILKLVF